MTKYTVSRGLIQSFYGTTIDIISMLCAIYLTVNLVRLNEAEYIATRRTID